MRAAVLLLQGHDSHPEQLEPRFLQGVADSGGPLHLTTSAHQIDIVDLVGMDAVAAGAPVIEFFDFAEQMHTSFVDANGSKTSIYRTEGLVEPASNESELDQFTSRAAEENGYLKKIQADQHASLATLFVDHGSATDRILKLLESLHGTKQNRIAA